MAQDTKKAVVDARKAEERRRHPSREYRKGMLPIQERCSDYWSLERVKGKFVGKEQERGKYWK